LLCSDERTKEGVFYDLSLGVAPAKARYVAVKGDEESHRVIGSTFDHRKERLCDRRDQVGERRSLVDFEPTN
jgi:hypothetical protein